LIQTLNEFCALISKRFGKKLGVDAKLVKSWI